VQPHAQLGNRPGPRHGVRGRGSSDHKARRREYTVPSRPGDRLVHGLVQAEIIGGDDQELQMRTTGKTEPSRFTRR
jgi:hypothetical protein